MNKKRKYGNLFDTSLNKDEFIKFRKEKPPKKKIKIDNDTINKTNNKNIIKNENNKNIVKIEKLSNKNENNNTIKSILEPKKHPFIIKKKNKDTKINLLNNSNNINNSTDNNNNNIVKKKRKYNKRNLKTIKKEKKYSNNQNILDITDKIEKTKYSRKNENVMKATDDHINKIKSILHELNKNDNEIDKLLEEFADKGSEYIESNIDISTRRRKKTKENMEYHWDNFHSILKISNSIKEISKRTKNDIKEINQKLSKMISDTRILRRMYWKQTRSFRTRLQLGLEANPNYQTKTNLLEGAFSCNNNND
jgi:hypothetical protein